MADPTRYTIEEVIALPKGTTPWYDQNQDAYRHIKNTMDVVADISGGGEPGFGSPIDIRHYVQDTSGSNVNYEGVTRPACTASDALVVGIQLILDVESPNTGACTLNIGTAEGAVYIKQFSESNVKQDPIPSALIGPTLLIYDGYNWCLDKSALPGGPGPEGPEGPPGMGLQFMGDVPTVSALPGYPTSYAGATGDTYLVNDTNNFYTWVEESKWMNIGHIQTVEPPFDLSQNALGDLGDVSDTAAVADQVLYWNGTQWISNKVTSEIILDGGVHEVDLATDSVGNRVLATNEDFTVNGTWTFTEPMFGDGSQLTNVVGLGNQATWQWGQYNALESIPQSNSGIATRFTWFPEQFPNVRLSSSEVMFTTAPGIPVNDGLFMAITWVSFPAQVWTFADNIFAPGVLPPENNGADVTRIFTGRDGVWHDV